MSPQTYAHGCSKNEASLALLRLPEPELKSTTGMRTLPTRPHSDGQPDCGQVNVIHVPNFDEQDITTLPSSSSYRHFRVIAALPKVPAKGPALVSVAPGYHSRALPSARIGRDCCDALRAVRSLPGCSVRRGFDRRWDAYCIGMSRNRRLQLDLLKGVFQRALPPREA